MSTLNNGNQSLFFSYLEEATGEGFNKTIYKLIPRGIYEGGGLNRIDDTSISINPMICFYEDTTNKIGLKIITEDLAYVTVSPTTPYVIGTFSWLSSSANYMDFEAVGYSEIEETDLIFGKVLYSGSVIIGFDYSRKTYSMSYYEKISSYYPPFWVVPNEPYDTQVTVYSGSFYFGSSKIEINEETLSPVFTFPVISGRIDFLCIDSDSNLQIVTGEDSSSPINPSIPFNYIPISKITLPSSATNIQGTYIEYIYTKNYKPNTQEYFGTNWTTSLHNTLGTNWKESFNQTLGLGGANLLKVSPTNFLVTSSGYDKLGINRTPTIYPLEISGIGYSTTQLVTMSGNAILGGIPSNFQSNTVSSSSPWIVPSGTWLISIYHTSNQAEYGTTLFQIYNDTNTTWETVAQLTYLAPIMIGPFYIFSDGIHYQVTRSNTSTAGGYKAFKIT